MNYIEEELRRQKVLLWELATLGRAELPGGEEIGGEERFSQGEEPGENAPLLLRNAAQEDEEQGLTGERRGMREKTEIGSRRSAAYRREENADPTAVFLSLAGGGNVGNAAASAREVSVTCERDARRYDGGYALY